EVVVGDVATEDLLERLRILGNAAHLDDHVVGRHLSISIGFRIGSFACSSSDGARPSQNCVALNIALRTVGLLRLPRSFGAVTPSASGLWSTKPFCGSWQVAQATVLVTESRLSLKSLSPRAAFSG